MKRKLVSICKKLGNWYTRHYAYLNVALLVVALVLAIVLPLTRLNLDLLVRIGLAQLFCGIVTMLFIIVTLYVVFRQLRISEAKPRLSLAFDELGTTETTLEVMKGKPWKRTLSLWMLNHGNAVAKEFQVRLDVPIIFKSVLDNDLSVGSIFTSYDIASPNKDIRILSFHNLKTPCFVDSPLKVLHDFKLEASPHSYKKYGEEYTIDYRIYGSWGGYQSGKLKIRVKKTESTEKHVS